MFQKVVPLNDWYMKLKRNKWNYYFDKFTFVDIFLLWLTAVMCFGFVYYFFADNSSYLYSSIFQKPVVKFMDHIYFSFITATTTGFGDITPVGNFKIVAIFQVILGLLLLAVVTSKLVSIKQDIILSEVYEISFYEKINRLRSSLLLFRQNISRILPRIEERVITKREVHDIYIYIVPLVDTLQEIEQIVEKPEEGAIFTKVVDSVNTELIFSSVIHSLEKLHELIVALNHSRQEWRRDLTVGMIQKVMQFDTLLFEKVKLLDIVQEQKVEDLCAQNSKVVKQIQEALVHSYGSDKARVMRR